MIDDIESGISEAKNLHVLAALTPFRTGTVRAKCRGGLVFLRSGTSDVGFLDGQASPMDGQASPRRV